MDLTNREESGCTVARVAGRLDAATAPVFEKACAEWIGKGTSKLFLDLSALDYVSSAGLRAILATMKNLTSAGGALAVSGLPGVVKEVFTISGFDAHLSTRDSVAEAIASF